MPPIVFQKHTGQNRHHLGSHVWRQQLWVGGRRDGFCYSSVPGMPAPPSGMMGGAAPQVGTTLAFRLSAVRVRVNEAVSAELTIAGASDVREGTVVQFDPKALRLVSMTPGPLATLPV